MRRFVGNLPLLMAVSRAIHSEEGCSEPDICRETGGTSATSTIHARAALKAIDDYLDEHGEPLFEAS